MEKFLAFLKKKNIELSVKRYFIDALGAMAQGLFASLLIGTIVSTIGTQFGIELLVTVGTYAKAAVGPAMAVAIGFALQASPLVLFSLAAVGAAANELGGAGGPLAVLVVTIFAAEFGKLVSKETKIDIIVTPFVTIFVGVGLSVWWAPAIGKAASVVGNAIMWATELQPFFMGIIVSVLVGIALTLPISSAAICAALGLTGLAGGAEEKLASRLASMTSSLDNAVEVLENKLIETKTIEDVEELAKYYRNEVFVAMQSLRAVADELETIVSSDVWPFPVYSDMLFKI